MEGTLTRRAHLGVELAAAEEGLGVLAVASGGTASHAGVRTGDVLLSIGDGPRLDVRTLPSTLRSISGGDVVTFHVRRDSGVLKLEAAAQPLPVERLSSGHIELSEVDVAGTRLRTVLSVPVRSPPCPAVMLLPGASWRSVEHPLEPDAALLGLVDLLTRGGVMTLRVERSGVGDSGGPHCTELDFEAELAGYRAGLAALTQRPDVKPRRIVLFGIGLGGMIAPLVAGDHPLQAVSVFGSSARPWSECVLAAAARRLDVGGVEPEARAQHLTALATLGAAVYREGLTPAQAFERMPELAEAVGNAYRKDRINGRVASFFQQLERAEIARAWSRVTTPVLALHGSTDHVCSLDDAREIAALAQMGSRAPCGALELEGVGHDLRGEDGAVREVGAALLTWLRAVR
jgi:hypothetical protein